jgi:hypothetical protein
MRQSPRMFRPSRVGRIEVRRNRFDIAVSTSTAVNTPPQTAAPVNAVFLAR